jgi:hypothetical protein
MKAFHKSITADDKRYDLIKIMPPSMSGAVSRKG